LPVWVPELSLGCREGAVLWGSYEGKRAKEIKGRGGGGRRRQQLAGLKCADN